MKIMGMGLDFAGNLLFKPMDEEAVVKALKAALEPNAASVRSLARTTAEACMHAKRDADRELNSFYEHAAALASISTQSKRLGTLLTGLESIVSQKDLPETSKNLAKMKDDLIQAQKILEKKPKSLEDFDKQINQSRISEISRKIITASSEAESTFLLKEKRIEKEILENRLSTLIEVRRLSFSNLNHWEIERAKYGGIGVPPLVENAIKEVTQDIKKAEKEISEVRERFAMLTTG